MALVDRWKVMGEAMKLKIILISIASVLLAGAYFVYSHSFLEITLANGVPDTEITYTVKTSDGENVSETVTTESNVRKLVPKGTYEIMVTQADRSFLSVHETEGFMSSTAVSANVRGEKHRTFIGNNPEPCATTTEGVLISVVCGDTVNNLKIHVPATTDRPTYTVNSSSPLSGYVEGLVKTKEGTFVLIKSPTQGEEEGAPHTLYRVNSKGQTIEGTALSQLNEDRFYSVTGYKQGFLVYDESGSEFFHYKTKRSKPDALNIPIPENDLKFYSVSTDSESIVVTYSNKKTREEPPFIDPEGIKEHHEVLENDHDHEEPQGSQVTILTSDKVKNYSFDRSPERVRLCGNSKLCLLEEGKLSVYGTDRDEQKLLYSLGDVNSIENTASGLLIARNEGVVLFDVDERQGYVEYSLGDYDYCGIKSQTGSYILCVVNAVGRTTVLHIDHSKNNTDSIDKKISELFELDEVKDISIYKNHISISPNPGQLTYNSDIQSFDYNPGVLKRVNSTINNKIDVLGIDRSRYRISITVN